VKYQFNHADEELDVDDLQKQAEEWVKDPTKPPPLMDTIQKGRAFDRAVERAKQDAQTTTQKQANDWYANWFRSQGYTTVKDPTAPNGFRLVGPQATTPAASTAPQDNDPLAIEERELKAKIKAAPQTDPDWLDRLSEIRAERATKRAKAEALAEWRAEQQKTEATSREQREEAEAQKWFYGEIDKLIAVRAKDFEGLPDAESRKQRLRDYAFRTGEEAARKGRIAVDAAQEIIRAEADGLASARRAWATSVTDTARPAAPPVVGGAPATGGGKKKPDLTTDAGWDEALDDVGQRVAARI